MVVVAICVTTMKVATLVSAILALYLQMMALTVLVRFGRLHHHLCSFLIFFITPFTLTQT